MKFKPLHHFLQIEKVPLKELKAKGVKVPEHLNALATVFRVVAAGPGLFDMMNGQRIPMSVKEGDVILCDAKEIINVLYSGSELSVIPETCVFGCFQLEETEK
jgi:co-chaperonin GroES (HSP10)